MSSGPTQYTNRNSLRRQSKSHQSHTRNPWTGTIPGGHGGSSQGQDLGSGYSGNSDTLSSGSRGKYTHRTSSRTTASRKAKSSHAGLQASAPPHAVCPLPEPAYENVLGGGGGSGRLSLGRYGTSSVVPAPQHASAVRKSHHHQGGTTTLYTLDGRGRDLGSGATASRSHTHVTYLGGAGGASTPLIELNSPGSRGSTTSHEVGTNNIYDVIEEKSSRGRGSSARAGGTLHSPGSLGLGMQHPAGGGFHYNRPLTPASVKTCASETGVYACGGHCLPFERVCDKILRVVYGIGVLVGIGLLLAGMNGHQLRQHQNTLMYIGLMVFCVCCLLLWIQCRHYASRRRHRRHHTTTSVHRTAVIPTLPSPHQNNMIPMTDFVNGTGTNYMMGGTQYTSGGAGNTLGVRYHAGGVHTLGSGTGHSPLIQNPLLHRYIEQQSSYTPGSELETHAATSSLYVQA